MESRQGTDDAAVARRARYGRLPDRVGHDELVEEKRAVPNDPTRYAHDPEASWRSFACLAADLGL
ncbi:hypothetical protein [Streptomyces griseus]|uniref:hypothetical protein n=1 Tax=Streptomyces griseus TaxID=1911 RepID=UPI00056ACD39|nr:hypothetical protein [Streptomyces griseus]